jgi:hypothetical protein
MAGGEIYSRALRGIGGLLGFGEVEGLYDEERIKQRQAQQSPEMQADLKRFQGLLGEQHLVGANENRISSPDSRWGEDPAEIEARLRGANAGWTVGQGAGAAAGARGMMPGLSQGGQIVAGGQRPEISPQSAADSRWGEDPEMIEATLRGRNAGWQVDQTGRGQDGTRGMMPGLSEGGRIAANGLRNLGSYAAAGGPFRQDGPLGGLTEQVAGGLVNVPRQLFGFDGTPQNDINRFASLAPTPMAGMNGPRMAGAGAAGAGAVPMAAFRPTPPAGMVSEQSRLDDNGDQWMVDPASGAEINLSEMERSTARYMEEGAGFSSRPDDLAGKVAQHVRNTSANVRELGSMMRDMEPGYDMMQDIEPGYKNGAQAYLPESAQAMVQGDRVRFIDPNPGEEFFKQLNQRNQGYATVTPMRRPPAQPIDPRYAEFENLPKLHEAADMIWSPPKGK